MDSEFTRTVRDYDGDYSSGQSHIHDETVTDKNGHEISKDVIISSLDGNETHTFVTRNTYEGDTITKSVSMETISDNDEQKYVGIHKETYYSENGTEKSYHEETYSQLDGRLISREEITYAEDGSSHRIVTDYDEKGDIDHQRIELKDPDGCPILIRESIPLVFTVDDLVGRNGHVDSSDDHENRIDSHTAETSWTDENGYEHTIETKNNDDSGETGTYKETIKIDPARSDTITREGHFSSVDGGDVTLTVDRETVESYRDNDTLESKTITIYDQEEKPVTEIKTTYAEDGYHVEKTERTDFFYKEDDSVEIIKTDTSYDEIGHIDKVTVSDIETDSKHIEISDAVADDSDYDRDFIEGSVDDDDEGWMDDGGDVDIE